jgi:DNA phosphorothioation-dependent restriction protein DptH
LYRQLNEFLTTNADNLEWGEAFALRYVDCVVDWSSGSLRHQTILLGPWHPLVVATRFMVQAGLYNCCNAFLTGETKNSFNRLAVLLHESSGFRWFPAMHAASISFVHGYVRRTSDPGWMACTKTDASDQETISGHLAGSLGLEVGNLRHDASGSLGTYLRGFFRAHPSRRAISVRLAGGYDGRAVVQRAATFLRGQDGPTRFGNLLPGGISLHLDRPPPSDMEPLPWAEPPLRVSVYKKDEQCYKEHSVDISVLPRESSESTWHSCDTPRVPRGAGDGTVFFLPLMRLTEGETATPTSVYSELESPEDASSDSLENSYRRALVESQALLPHLACTYISVNLPVRLRTPWTIVPGAQLDPAALVKYVRNAYDNDIEQRALWDYNVDFTKGYRTYYVLSRVPAGFRTTLLGSPVLAGRDMSTDFLRELGEVGVAIGSEAMRSGNHALGVIGIVGAIRLFCQTAQCPGPFHVDKDCAGFLLPIDSFVQLLHDSADEQLDTSPTDTSHRRADLVAIQLTIAESTDRVSLSLCTIECKYASTVFAESRVPAALRQAQETFERLKALADSAIGSNVAARLALAHVVSFGLRLTCDNTSLSLSRNARILQAILRGRITVVAAASDALLVSTEAELREAEIRKRGGWWIRLAPDHWPGLAESACLTQSIRSEVASLFADLLGNIRSAQLDNSVPPRLEFRHFRRR